MTDKVKFLLVDDLEDNLIALSALIQRNDIEVFTAQSGAAALNLLLEHEFALAMLDVQMPNMNGFELAELMRGTNRTKHIPIIFVTAGAKDQQYTFKGYESGAVDFLNKPLDTHAVKSKVGVFLDLYLQRKKIKEQLDVVEKIRIEQQKLVDELLQTKAKLEKAVNVRDEFMSLASHELKTPLTTLKLQTQVRQRNLNKSGTDKFTKENLQTMLDTDNRQLDRLVRLIDEMLDTSRINLGKLGLSLESFDLSTTVREVAERFQEQAAAQNSRIIVDTCESITGVWDKFRLEQVVSNLITNAIRYGEGKPIHVSLTKAENMAIIKVRDEGRGIAAENQKRIFERFERAVSSSEISGLGLGLYIVKEILRAHSGTIHVESELGKGATFIVQLPTNKVSY